MNAPLYEYKPVSVQVTDDGKLQWQEVEESNIRMFQNTDPEIYQKAMREVIKILMKALPEL